MKKRTIAGTAADPTLPKTPITIKGKTYDLCFTFGALAEAETSINVELARKGSTESVNMLYQFPMPNLANTRACFAAALRTFHPEISFADAIEMVTPSTIVVISSTIMAAWNTAFMDGEEKAADPQQPGE